MGKVKIPQPTVRDILAPFGQVVRQEGSAIVQDALDRRRHQIQQFVQMKQRDLEEIKERELELQKLMTSVEEIQKSNLLSEAKIAELKSESSEETKAKLRLEKYQNRYDKMTKLHAKAQTDLEDLQKETKFYEEFQSNIGIQYLGRQEDSNRILLVSTKIHPLHPDDQYYLYFDTLDPCGPDLRFKVSCAEPTFSQFDELASMYNESQKFKEFIDQVQDHWRRDASMKS